jgi:hypothetical protein
MLGVAYTNVAHLGSDMLKFASSKQPQGHSKRAELDVDLHSFTKALVANLVGLNVRAVRPHDTNDRRGFAGVVRALDAKVKSLDQNGHQNVKAKTAFFRRFLLPHWRNCEGGMYTCSFLLGAKKQIVFSRNVCVRTGSETSMA